MGNDRQAGKHTNRFAAWLKSLSGILSSLAALVTAVATIFAAYQTMRVHEQSRTIAQQGQQLRQFKSQAAPTATVTPGSSGGGTSGGATLPQKGYLSALQPTVSSANPGTGPQTMSSKSYQDSVTFACNGTYGNDQPDVAYDVSGSQAFTAVVGIPDNTPNVTGVDETVIFASQDGTQLAKPVVVSLGSPARVHLNISSVTQLEVTCTGVDVHTHQPDNGGPLTLGNAGIS
jgi:NPCBM/NEW2 domain